MSYEFRFDVLWDNLPYLVNGVWVTLQVAAIAISLGVVLGLVTALFRLSKYRILAAPARLYLIVFRNTPVLVQLMWIYYGLPIVFGLETEPLTSSALALGVSAGAFLSEIFRAGILSIERGQIESARSLGMSTALTMRQIILPQAVRQMLPPFGNMFVEYVKYSSLVSILGVSDLTYRAQVLAVNTFRPMEIYTGLAVSYLILCTALTYGVDWMERRVRIPT